MRYERVCYMCPKCNQIQFFNAENIPSIMCPECKVEMQNMGSDFVDSEEERRKKEQFQRGLKQVLENPEPIIYCPSCNSMNTSKISTTSKVLNTAIFGIFGTKRHKQWHCNRCNSDF